MNFNFITCNGTLIGLMRLIFSDLHVEIKKNQSHQSNQRPIAPLFTFQISIKSYQNHVLYISKTLKLDFLDGYIYQSQLDNSQPIHKRR